MQILGNYYYEQPPLASTNENKYDENNFSLNVDRYDSDLHSNNKPNPTVDSVKSDEATSLPLHFYLQNLHYQRLNHSISAATKEKRKQKQPQ